MPKLLKDMRLDEISLVDEPASPGARVALFKRRAPSEFSETEKAVAIVKMAFSEDQLSGEATQAFEQALEIGFAPFAATEEATPDHPALPRLVKGLGQALRSVFADEAISADQRDALIGVSTTQFAAAVAAITKEKAKAMKPCADCKNPEACKSKGACAMSEDKNDIEKRVTEATAKAVSEAIAKAKVEADAEIKKAKEEAAAAIAKANEEIAKINEAKAEEVRLAKAKTLVEGIPGMEAETVAKALKGMDADTQAAFEKTLNAAREAAKLGKVTKELGNNGSGIAAGSASEQIAKAAAAIREKQPDLTNAQAVAKALDAKPELYSAYIAERP